MSSEGIREAAHQVGGVLACLSDGQEAGFIPLSARVNPSKKTHLGFQLEKSNLWNSLVFSRTNYTEKRQNVLNQAELVNIVNLIFIKLLNYYI